MLIISSHLLDKDIQLESKVEVMETDTSAPIPKRDSELVCPHCGAIMNRVDYNSTGIIIDSCIKCHYRWLDRGEFGKIIEFKPRINPDDLLFLLDLKLKTEAIVTKGSDDPNPEVPLSSGVLGGLIRGNMAGDSRRTLSYLAGAGISGLIIGIIKSRFIRVLAPFIIIGFIILGYLIMKQMQLIDWAPIRHSISSRE
ncbi:zf-TFIIB domain-containing protein [Candidatus Saccharibacteria bacterium]|nr:MAG: zf-TFIIB domain-containing protein [Candidatus Saccharibacteria bacterium]